eukprot:SAG31_NODE_8161_length_1506_cov_1.821606_1_plen_385_part_01
MGEVRLGQQALVRRTTTRPRGQGTPGFVLRVPLEHRSRSDGENDSAGAIAQEWQEFHVQMLSTAMAVDEFESWMDALGPYLAAHSVGVSLRFLQRFVKENPTIVSEQMTTAQAYAEFVVVGLKPTESYVEAHLKGDPQSRGRHAHELGPATTYISHALSAPAVQLIGSLAEIELQAGKQQQIVGRAYYWLDIFCQSEFSPGEGARNDRQPHKYRQRDIVRAAFNAADICGVGGLSMGGMANALQRLGIVLPRDRLQELMVLLDVDGSGSIQLPEFEAVVAEHREHHGVELPSDLLGPGGDEPAVATERLKARRPCLLSAWHQASGVPKMEIIVCGWPTPQAFHAMNIWHELLMAIDVGADFEVHLSAAARASFLAQIESGDLSFS